MGSKKSLMDEITRRANKKKALTEEIAGRDKNIEEFVLKLLNEIDASLSGAVNPSLVGQLAPFYASTLQQRIRIRVLDNSATVVLSWQEASDEESVPRVSGVLITWSKEYQTKNSCEEQLFVDVMSLLLK